jgi:hypothetical protein
MFVNAARSPLPRPARRGSCVSEGGEYRGGGVRTVAWTCAASWPLVETTLEGVGAVCIEAVLFRIVGRLLSGGQWVLLSCSACRTGLPSHTDTPPRRSEEMPGPVARPAVPTAPVRGPGALACSALQQQQPPIRWQQQQLRAGMVRLHLHLGSMRAKLTLSTARPHLAPPAGTPHRRTQA